MDMICRIYKMNRMTELRIPFILYNPVILSKCPNAFLTSAPTGSSRHYHSRDRNPKDEAAREELAAQPLRQTITHSLVPVSQPFQLTQQHLRDCLAHPQGTTARPSLYLSHEIAG